MSVGKGFIIQYSHYTSVPQTTSYGRRVSSKPIVVALDSVGIVSSCVNT